MSTRRFLIFITLILCICVFKFFTPKPASMYIPLGISRHEDDALQVISEITPASISKDQQQIGLKTRSHGVTTKPKRHEWGVSSKMHQVPLNDQHHVNHSQNKVEKQSDLNHSQKEVEKQSDFNHSQKEVEKQSDFKIQLITETGIDSALNPMEFSLALIKNSLEKTYKAALEYLDNTGQTTQTPTVRKNITKIVFNDMNLYKDINPSYNLLKDTLNPAENITKHKISQETQQHSTNNVDENHIQLEASTKLPTLVHEKIPCKITTRLTPCQCSRELQPMLNRCSGNLTKTEILKEINDTSGESTCSNWATMRGKNQKVISFSLFGKFPNAYFNHTSSIIQQISAAYPGWYVRFYHDLNLANNKEKEWLCSIACKYQQVDFCSVHSLPGGLGDLSWTIGTVWRLGIMGDPLVEKYMIRDADSPILPREVSAVHEWINSKKCFHVMRDNPLHNQPMMGGMWGGCQTFHPEAMPRLRDTVFKWSRKSVSVLSRDQINVAMLLWPTIRKDHIGHDAYTCLQYPGSRPYPTQRVNFTFVGMRSFREKYATDRNSRPCPLQCRPANHKDWIYC